ncbi:hypothetical protein BD324DRAFT_490479 [Kockovaella imperatae]|uniref:C3H1-type domain-containing protein n=1 Tax=Kockovaella imperatae TaxID=4999 RepID=A0A1Y1UE83_9TREE|nr:hypothetical protein BD324DRAFT_490479 [Kockovaella imperatae]ORX36353.1 hypothetical protein BD324DRAFT_490479 [Kockovaella imperatae]
MSSSPSPPSTPLPPTASIPASPPSITESSHLFIGLETSSSPGDRTPFDIDIDSYPGHSPSRAKLPTPSSFSQRLATTPTSPRDESTKSLGGRKDVGAKSLPSRHPFNLYTIPQKADTSTNRNSASPIPPPSAYVRRGPPTALNLHPVRMPLGPGSTSSPFSRHIPASAPLSKIASVGAARRLSDAQEKPGRSPAPPNTASLDRNTASKQKIKPTTPASIWTEGLPNPRTSGWISPALTTGRSITSATSRPRGLQVAILNDSKQELIIGDLPIHGGNPLKSPVSILNSNPQGATDQQGSGSDSRRREIILCRYYHTPGLTCTSRPCRFVHALETKYLPTSTGQVPSTAPVALRLVSPKVQDPTGGIFAKAQSSTKSPRSTWRNSMPSSGISGIARPLLASPILSSSAQVGASDDSLSIAEIQDSQKIFASMEPGQRVVLATEDGVQLNGTVFLMSGGGKGAVGKSKAKYKTVGCKDYAAGYCPYGDYCSFIHQVSVAVESPGMVKSRSEDLLTTLEIPQDESESNVADPTPLTVQDSPARRRHSTGSYARAVRPLAIIPPVLEAESSNVILVQNIDEDTVGDRMLDQEDAVEMPKETSNDCVGIAQPVKTDADVCHQADVPGPSPVSARSSAWSRGPPASLKSLTLKKVSISNLSNSTGSRLVPPPSAVSFFGTESDPATPWDPALRQQQTDAIRDTPWNHSAYASTIDQTGEVWPTVDQANSGSRKRHNQDGRPHERHGTDIDSVDAQNVHPEYEGPVLTEATTLQGAPPQPSMVHPPYGVQPYVETASPDHRQGWPFYDPWTGSFDRQATDMPTSPGMWSSPPPIMYPWGMPMSPVVSQQPHHQENEAHDSPKMEKGSKTGPVSHLRGMSSPVGLPHVPGGLGVMWTPAGWAVQDAAMKLDLRLAEMKFLSEITGNSVESAQNRDKKVYYKSRQCLFFSHGNCPHGDQCTYRYDPPSRTSSPSNPSTDPITPATQRSRTSTQGSPVKRKPMPVLPCKFFNSTSGCSRGTDCTFLHAMVVPISMPLVDRPRPWRTKPCRHWLVGRCTLGDACHFAHVDANGNDEHVNPPLRLNTSAYDMYSAEIPLSEADVSLAMRDIKRYSPTRVDSDDEEEDNVEIIP